MTPTDPKIVAAPIGPIPRMSHRPVPEAATATRIRFFDVRIWVSSRAMLSTSSAAITTRCLGHLVGDPDAFEQEVCLVNGHF
jgi:hypothetical protein